MNYDDIAEQLGLTSWDDYYSEEDNQERLQNLELSEYDLRQEWEAYIEDARSEHDTAFNIEDLYGSGEDEEEYDIMQDSNAGGYTQDDWDEYTYDED